jgi:hypothetical protein
MLESRNVPQAADHPVVAPPSAVPKAEEVARAIAKLSPEEAAYFMNQLELVARKRKIQIAGYLVAMVGWLVTMVLALVYTGMHNGVVVWMFLVPFAFVGAILYGFGRWAEHVWKTPPKPARAAGVSPEQRARP